MGCHTLYDAREDKACLFDSTTMTAFGRVFSGPDADAQVDAFLAWYEERHPGEDPRRDADIGAEQDTWLLSFDPESGPDWTCLACGADPWVHCDPSVDPHSRKPERTASVRAQSAGIRTLVKSRERALTRRA